jgi:hypothetical protein
MPQIGRPVHYGLADSMVSLQDSVWMSNSLHFLSWHSITRPLRRAIPWPARPALCALAVPDLAVPVEGRFRVSMFARRKG